ncbi:PSP1 C-terminal conserved region-domain-containing protein [Phascolomyces articulosus]|uniref:PSP1 C-terminal conserved region-domain-containing protein n=1 Tax=Phascolomyces articulosus TaxID=60185 RepID=A0AAD5K993_9FUNG|nr:PSP1 C-terminal conserved region-domain-containing protein [Phascolomyces articulosus]
MISQMSRSIHPNNTLSTNDNGTTNDMSHSSSVLNSTTSRSTWKAVGSPPRSGGRQGLLSQQSSSTTTTTTSSTASNNNNNDYLHHPMSGNSNNNNGNGNGASSDHQHQQHHHSSTSSSSLNWLQQDYAFPPIRRNSAVSTAAAVQPLPAAPWATSTTTNNNTSTTTTTTTLPTPSSSISTSSNVFFPPTTLSDGRRSSFIEYPDIASVPMLPEVSTEPFFREHRSMSYSIDNSTHHPTTDFNNSRFAQHLVTMHEEEDDDDMIQPLDSMTYKNNNNNNNNNSMIHNIHNNNNDDLMPSAMDDEMLAAAQLRARSKSSAAAFDIWHPAHPSSEDSWTGAAARLASQRRSSVAHAPPSFHHHHHQQQQQLHHHHHHPSSLGSMYSPPPPPPSSSSFMSNGDRERLASLRRFSLSPMPDSRLQGGAATNTSTGGPLSSNDADRNAFAFLSQRRHSLATPVPQNTNVSVNELLEGLQSLRMQGSVTPPTTTPSSYPSAAATVAAAAIQQTIQQQPPTSIQDDLSADYPPENMGKGSLLVDIDENALFCVVEFKRGRSDMYFTRPDQSTPSRNDLVIVEADRGHDLGKVTLDRISRTQLVSMVQQQQEKQQQQQQQQQHQLNGGANNVNGEVENTNKKKEVAIKQVIRLAKPNEITLLMGKSQDEAKALLVCQSKVKQKQMPMQVVDAEYQWDKRKLTFYFIADRRVDFRELVRDLFKLYKTRIWMCAVGSNQP